MKPTGETPESCRSRPAPSGQERPLPGTEESGTVRVVVDQPAETGPGIMRIDRWLFGVRLFRTRAGAADAVSGGKVHLNGERVRPSHTVKPNDMVAFTRSTVPFECAHLYGNMCHT